MPLNSIPPTTTVPNLDAKRHAAQGQCYTDIAFWGGVIPGNQVCVSLRLPTELFLTCFARIDPFKAIT